MDKLDKIIKESINEVIAYHGSFRDFDKFSLSSKKGAVYNGCMFGRGIYVTSSHDEASHYSKTMYGAYTENSTVYSVEIPDDNGSNYVDFDKRLPLNIRKKIIEYVFPFIIHSNQYINKYKVYTKLCLCNNFESFLRLMRRIMFTKGNRTRADEILNRALYEIGIVGTKVEQGHTPTWYILYNPVDVKIIKKEKVLGKEG